ncbi:cyanase [Pseudokineococcus sp. 1T1Z-3]|uniref:cyanase n=1 Tax=Pseudokineococcus sp. 1T1Z-3 TaxID=3132745 RepID=UPI0030A40BC6
MTTPMMSRAEAAALVRTARSRQGVTWAAIAEEVGAPLVWTTSALLGQHPMDATRAKKACAVLGLGDEVVEALQQQPYRGIDPALLQDPTIYRFHEALMVYGPALKELIHEEFGDGIMSAIAFNVDIARKEMPEGDRVVVTFDGKFLDYKW